MAWHGIAWRGVARTWLILHTLHSTMYNKL